jgi:hypothetical protein
MSRLETRLSDGSGSLKQSCCIPKAAHEAKTTILCRAFYTKGNFKYIQSSPSTKHLMDLFLPLQVKGHPNLDMFWFIRLLLPIINVISQSVFQTQGLPSTWGSPTFIYMYCKKTKTIQSKVEQSLRDLLLKPMFISINGWMEQKTSNKHEHR